MIRQMNGKTVAQIALELHESQNRVRYMIGKYNVVACRVVGITRLYDDDAVSVIKKGLFNIRIEK